MENFIETALKTALEAHAGQLDRNGYPAVLHPLQVGLMGHTDEEKTAGFLHEVMEVSPITDEELLSRGIPVGIINAVKILTRHDGTSHDDHIQAVIGSGNPIALQVKYNDLKHSNDDEKALKAIDKAIEDCSKVSAYSPAGNGLETAIFACGCFWGAQHHFDKEPGVVRTLAGYTGGDEDCPSYADVRDHKTHHVEAIIVEYDPSRTDYTQLCKVFFEIHDPAQTDGVGPDIGPQYRSCIFYRSEEQKSAAQAVIAILRNSGDEVNTLLLPAKTFYIGEEYHQHYYEKTGGSPYCHLRIRKF